MPEKVNYTLCVPSSIISKANAKNLQQATSILYQLAKVASIHNVGEIVVIDSDKCVGDEVSGPIDTKKKIKFDDEDSSTANSKSDISEDAMVIATILQYFVTPPYLVKTIFKQKFWKNFQYAKDLPKLTRLPFMAPDSQSKYREGLTVPMGKVSKPQNAKTKAKSKPLTNTKYVNVGYQEYLELSGQQVPVNVRVTVDTSTKKIVSPREAYEDQVGVNSSYGYHVRLASTFAKVFTESAYPEGYTKTLFVSGGEYHHHDKHPKLPASKAVDGDCLLLIVSKWSELERLFKQDRLEGVDDVKQFFDGEVPVPWGLRVEDSAMYALTKLSPA